MKKFLCAVLTVLMVLMPVLSLSSCNKNGGKPSGSDSAASGVASGDGSLASIEITPNPPKESSAPEETQPEEPESDPTLAPYNPENEIVGKEELSEEFKYLAGLDTKQVPWGPGRNFDPDGKPTACTLLQKEYGDYSADFVRIGDQFDKKVYLTFDEGYENGYTSGSVFHHPSICKKRAGACSAHD